MATIVKRVGLDGAITHQVRVRLQRHPAQTATFERLTDAKRWAQSTEAAIREGRYFPRRESQLHTFGDAVARYLIEVLPNKRPNTQRGQHTQLLWWKARLGSYAIGAITPALIIEARERLKREPDRHGRPRTGAIVNRYLAALSHFFTVACREWHWLERNPMGQVRKLKEGKGRARYLSDGEREVLLSACKSPQLSIPLLCWHYLPGPGRGRSWGCNGPMLTSLRVLSFLGRPRTVKTGLSRSWVLPWGYYANGAR